MATTAPMEELIDDLIYGGRAGDLDEISAALAAGAPIDGRDGNGTTSLMMAAANGHVEAMRILLDSGADVNAINERKNSAMHWAVFTNQAEAVKCLLAAKGVDLMIKNEHGLTAAMDADRTGKGELMALILNSVNDEDVAADLLGLEPDDKGGAGGAGGGGGGGGGPTQQQQQQQQQHDVQKIEKPEGVDKTLDGEELKVMKEAPAETSEAAIAATRGVLSGETVSAAAEEGELVPVILMPPDSPSSQVEASSSSGSNNNPLISRTRPEAGEDAIAQRVLASAAQRKGDWRYSVLPGVLPFEKILDLSTSFFETTELLAKDGNTFGPEFEQQYSGHRNYFYYVNRNQVVEGAEKAAFIFEELDKYTRQVVELHHPREKVKLERAFGAYYEGERDGFHLGVNEHCDGDANLVSTVVHAVLPDGDVGFTKGGELTISEVDELDAIKITHSNETIGSVVYLGGSIFHHATPIQLGQKRLVFCMFYACEGGKDLSKHALV